MEKVTGVVALGLCFAFGFAFVYTEHYYWALWPVLFSVVAIGIVSRRGIEG